MARYRLAELGWAQFEQLCDEVLRLEAGIAPSAWSGRADGTRVVEAPEGLTILGRTLPGPATVTATWSARAMTVRTPAGDGPEIGPAELSRLLDERPELRRRVPSVLGICDLDELIPPE